MDEAGAFSYSPESSSAQDVRRLLKTIRKKNLIFADWLLLNGSFWLMHWLSGEHSNLAPYLKLFAVINLMWLFQLLQYHRFRHIRLEPLFLTLKNALFNAGYLLLATAVLSVFLKLSGFSRYHVFGTFVLYLICDISLLLAYRGVQAPSISKLFRPGKRKVRRNEPLLVLLADLGLLFVSFFIVHLLKYGTIVPNLRAGQALLIISTAWLITAKWTGKFEHKSETNVHYAQAPYIKAFYISIAIMSAIVFALGLFQHSRTVIFGAFVLLLAFELPMVYIRVVGRRSRQIEHDIETIDQVKSYIKQHELPIDPGKDVVKSPAAASLRDGYLASVPGVYRYIAEYLDPATMDKSRVRVLDTDVPYNISTIERQHLNLFVNLTHINHFRHLNQYFLQVHSKLRNGGYFVLRSERLENYRDRLEKRFPQVVATFIYTLHFLWHRVLPKISGLSALYYTISRGRNQVITRAEIIGRLHFCGFHFIDFKRIGDNHWFIARKTKVPAVDRNPSFGPLITLPRIGYGGKIFQLYKFRTMHSYAEYLQDFVYETCQLDDSGKFKDDFRLTQWGKVMRKYWLDELPQIINYVRGDIRLLGVRAISAHYFSLYPKDVQQLRIQFKPGLVPPYYADLPKNFTEIVESERNYLLAKKRAPFRTDVIYFARALKNIVLKKARSG
ncbi:sugar transferase [candidate division KSB1 bacterium]|nr:sugar transferase [candidate division KSB1 bacterium]